jgi:L-ascorbate metabolism protein UlaG (beta-lactamase superfamily)
MRLQLIRHATLLVEYKGYKLLVDPMLSETGAQPPIDNSPNPRNNPLVGLPMAVKDVIDGVAAVLVTHTHRDHWDAAAAQLLSKNLLLLGQPEDESRFRSEGFSNVQAIGKSTKWNGIDITRTGGRHGTGEIGKKMAPVSGFVLQSEGEPALYIAGDTIWCDEVQSAIDQFHPDVIVVNAGAAQFLQGGPITMTADDVITTCGHAPRSRVIAVHMEAINHCLLTRADLAFQLEAARVTDRVSVPADGEWISLDLNA